MKSRFAVAAPAGLHGVDYREKVKVTLIVGFYIALP
jgi:hypothetical protein